ncbi:Origin recognition complex [Babesia duncani]|uniref:Origin recognition complex n=1 Tax=Babesia duncani TaxID=323732 RepID=A0AAD9PI78_9APIC|nr:Origin recognition complex [Babesia duncani]
MWKRLVHETLNSIVAIDPKEARRTSRHRFFDITTPLDFIDFINTAGCHVPIGIIVDRVGVLERCNPDLNNVILRLHESINTRVIIIYVNVSAQLLQVPKLTLNYTKEEITQRLVGENFNYAHQKARMILGPLAQDTGAIKQLWEHFVHSVYQLAYPVYRNYRDFALYAKITWPRYLEPYVTMTQLPPIVENGILDVNLSLLIRKGLAKFNSRHLKELQGISSGKIVQSRIAKYLLLGACLASVSEPFKRKHPNSQSGWNYSSKFTLSRWIACAQLLYATNENDTLQCDDALHRQLVTLISQGHVKTSSHSCLYLPLGSSGRLWGQGHALKNCEEQVNFQALLTDSARLIFLLPREECEAIARDLGVDLSQWI